ncbi:hypothetical protein B0T19DRAFT_468045 [Cercophora scortea]|uniref:Uncharacterized protein n=1 Tax=Cercophora scortea TaxID=314031 RepID=A0AAE0I7M9_9PEZI|nr:hypothetical protein B0T19DRAFT_468045 [Cercophora scortea]
MADPFATSQVNDTNPKEYDQVILASQATINAQLKNMWALADEKSNIRTFTVSNLAGSIDGAKLEAPEISLNIVDRTKPIYYYLKFMSGTLKVSKNSKQRPDNTTADFNVAGWSVCFPAQISRVMVEKDGDEFKNHSAKTGLDSGSVFSLAKFFLDATTSTLYIASLSKFGDIDWAKQPDVVRKNFKTFMSQWMIDMAEDQQTVLGYSVVAADGASVNAHAPSFPPTAVDHCNYPWRDPSNSANLKTVKNDKDSLPENGFCYLITTQSKVPPDAQYLAYSGTFVNQTHGAVFCMNRAQFWGDWLLTADLLRKLARGTEMIPTAPYIKDVSSDYPDEDAVVEVAPRFVFGKNPDHPSEDGSYFAFIDHGSEWTWTGNLLSKSESVYVPSNGKTSSLEETARSSVKATFVAGGQRIIITGSNWFIMRYSKNTGEHSTAKVETAWHLTFALAAVNDGGLQITRVPDPARTENVKTTVTSENNGVNWSYPWDKFAGIISSTLRGWFDSSLAWLTNGLINALKGHHRLFLPASGVFLMQDPRFNKRGDLLVGLHYDGAEPPADNVPSGDKSKAKVRAAGFAAAPRQRFAVSDDPKVPDVFKNLPIKWASLPTRATLLPVQPDSHIPSAPEGLPAPVPVFA